MKTRLTTKLAAMAATVAVAAASCGGKTITVTLADGGSVNLEASSFCKTLDLSKYYENIASPPSCDPNDPPADMCNTTTSHAGPTRGDSCNPVCKEWARSFALPIVPEAMCAIDGPLHGTCLLSGYIAIDDHSADCLNNARRDPNPPQAVKDAPKYCAAFFSQLVLGDGVAAGRCEVPVEWQAIGANQYPMGKCIDTVVGWDYCDDCLVFNTNTTPPTPSMCVQRNGKWRCERWCEPH